MENNYLSIANNDFEYYKHMKEYKYYNNTASLCQQICEKLLKAVIEQVIPNACNELRTHNLKKLFDLVKSEISIEREYYLFLGTLTDYYYNARYPGDDFVNVSEEDAMLCYAITEELHRVVNDWFRNNKPVRPDANVLIQAALSGSK